MDQARRFLPFPKVAFGVGQCPDAPLGPVADVSESRVLSTRVQRTEDGWRRAEVGGPRVEDRSCDRKEMKMSEKEIAELNLARSQNL